MKFTQLAPLALGGILLSGVLAGASFAQQPPPPAPQAGGPGGPRDWKRPDPAAMAARRAEHLRAALQLRPDQEPALKAYLDAGRPAERPAPGARQAMAGMTTPQRLDVARTRMTERLARFDQRAAATKRFYAQLSPTQQKAFDAMAQERMGERGKGGGRRGGGGHGMDHGMGHGD